MNINQAVARGYNFFVVAVLGIVAGSLVGEVPEEGVGIFKLDELLVIAVAVVAVVWYLIGQHRYQRSFVPLALAAAAFMAKTLGLVIELRDKVESGDDFSMVQVLLLLIIVAGVAYYRTRPAALDATAPQVTTSASHTPVHAGQ